MRRGNVLLLKDGRLGLIDFGQCVRLSDDQVLALARLVVALADAPAAIATLPCADAPSAADPPDADSLRPDELLARQRVVDAAVALGFRTRRMSPEGLAALASFFLDRDPPPSRGGRRFSPAQTLRTIDRYDPILELPEDYILAARVSLLMRGTSQLMAQSSVSIAQCWRPAAQRVIDAQAPQSE